MKKAFLKISAVCAACSMLTASAWAQSESQSQPSSDSSATRALSTKHLSATGRDGEHSIRASQLLGAAVNDSAGKGIATIEDTIIDPKTGRIDFALLSLNTAAEAASSAYSGNPTANPAPSNANASSPNKLVPVPWTLLKTSASSAQYATSTEKPTFTLNNVDQNKLTSAPTISTSDLSQSQWRQRIYAYYGVTPGVSSMGQSPMGGADSPAGEIKGEGARKMENPAPHPQDSTVP
jgi:sporulation protein YlmC with PRC-barrel domain